MRWNLFKLLRPRRALPRQSRPPAFRLALEQLESRELLSTSVLTYHNDLGRTGQNLNETVLTPGNVNSATFGQLTSYSVDGEIYAQPLYQPGVTLPDQTTHNIVFAATEHDSVYAFDADGGGLLWQTSFIDPANGVTTFSTSDAYGCGQISPEIGITATPVIDAAAGIIYVVAQTKEVAGGVTTYHQRLHALNITTGQEALGGPVDIQASVPGTGDGGSTVTFNPRDYKERPGLLLLNGVVYTAWSSHCDIGQAHGWVIGYDARSLQQVSVFNTSPNGRLDTIWQGGGALAADGGGNIYFETGNGSHDLSQGNYSEAFLKLSTGGGTLSVADYFVPYNWSDLDDRDADLGSGAPMLLPDQPGGHPHLLIGAGKEGTVYLVDRDNMGGQNPDFDNVVQELVGAISGGSWDTPAYFDAGAAGRYVYYAGSGDSLKAFGLSNGLLSTDPTSQSDATFDYPGATPSVSANGTTNGIVWALANEAHALLRAFDALDLSHALYDSDQAGTRDQLDSGVKFAVPAVADGKVFVGTADSLTIFGLLSPGAPRLPEALSSQAMFPGDLAPSKDDTGPASGLIHISDPTADPRSHALAPIAPANQKVLPPVVNAEIDLIPAFEGSDEPTDSAGVNDLVMDRRRSTHLSTLAANTLAAMNLQQDRATDDEGGSIEDKYHSADRGGAWSVSALEVFDAQADILGWLA